LSDGGPLVEMTKAEMDAFLSQVMLARLATVREDGRPHVTPIWYLWDGKRVWMETSPDYLKVKNIENNPHCAVVIDTSEGGMRNRGVIIEGKAELISGPEELVTKTVSRIYVRYLGREAMHAPTPKEMYDAPHVLIKLTPDKIVTWGWTKQAITPLW
jgi:PPOX class probable F420-dependent enzyme